MAALKTVNRICWVLALSCIVVSTAIAVLGVWGVIGDAGVLWRALATLGVVFLGSLAALVVNKALWYSTRGRDNDSVRTSRRGRDNDSVRTSRRAQDSKGPDGA